MERIVYKGFFIDRTDSGYRISKQPDSSIHTHLHNKNPCFKLIDNVVRKRIPRRSGLYYLESHIRLAEDFEYKRKLQDYYETKLNKGTRQRYYNPHIKRFWGFTIQYWKEDYKWPKASSLLKEISLINYQ